MVKNKKPASVVDFRNLIRNIEHFYRGRNIQNQRDSHLHEKMYPTNLLGFCENDGFIPLDFMLNQSQKYTLNRFMNRLT
jgi:hypothetical protein